jgi:hypothetical protein
MRNDTAATAVERHALLSAILGKAFKGELQ